MLHKFSQGPVAMKWWSWDLNPNNLVPNIYFNHYAIVPSCIAIPTQQSLIGLFQHGPNL